MGGGAIDGAGRREGIRDKPARRGRRYRMAASRGVPVDVPNRVTAREDEGRGAEPAAFVIAGNLETSGPYLNDGE